VSDAGHCIVVPKKPKMPEPIIPPFPEEPLDFAIYILYYFLNKIYEIN
jgi:hypothetical protein